jgi:hypothetical protein
VQRAPGTRRGYQLGLPGEAALTLSGATEHHDYPLALAITAIDAASRGDLDAAEERGSRALDAYKRLHPQTDSDVENLVCQARADVAMSRGAFVDAVAYNKQAADIARTNGKLAVASVNLAFAAWFCTIAGDETGAVPLAGEALALARQADMPYVLITALLVLGIALADTDPDQARACLDESLDRRAALGYENPNSLGLAIVLVSRLDDAPRPSGSPAPRFASFTGPASLSGLAKACTWSPARSSRRGQPPPRSSKAPPAPSLAGPSRRPPTPKGTPRVRAQRRGPRAVSSWRCDAKPLGSSRPCSARNV